MVVNVVVVPLNASGNAKTDTPERWYAVHEYTPKRQYTRIHAYISNRFMAKIHSKSMYAVHIRTIRTLRTSYIYARASLTCEP